ncbi:unnamed protein product [Caenorhabditis angaria]|uniref:C3H1-type domain-containing protein n=1 Tax=Caenorhabditis angaria TaxID=860376 RepID=A0A9P1MZR8_9PELO|nr:unnamed protein product [Caenorhabditis angaria]
MLFRVSQDINYRNDSHQTCLDSRTKMSIVGILRKTDPPPKRKRKSVSFIDSIGEVLVNIREIPKREQDNEVHVYEQTNGKYMKHQEPIKLTPWKMVKCIAPNNLLNIPRDVSKAFLVEEERRIREGISSAPLFGDFEMIDDPLLYIDALKKQNEPILQIPLFLQAETSKIEEKTEEKPSKSSSFDVLSLVSKLKQKGIILSNEQPQPQINNNNNMVIHNNPAIFNVLKPNPRNYDQICTYFVFREDGCRYGNTCRFIHDQQQRLKILTKKQEEKIMLSIQKQQNSAIPPPPRKRKKSIQ